MCECNMLAELSCGFCVSVLVSVCLCVDFSLSEKCVGSLDPVAQEGAL